MSKPVSTGKTSKKKAALSRPAYSYTSAGGEKKSGHPNRSVPNGINGGSQSYNQGTSSDSKVSKSLLDGLAAGAKTGGKVGKTSTPIPKALSAAITKGAQTGGTISDALNASGGGGDAGGAGSVYDGLSVPDVAKLLKASGASSKTLESYIKDATKDLGPGTNYGAIRSQLQKDTGRSDTNIKNMYAALQSGIRANDPILKSIYTDAATSTTNAGAQARSSINSAYDSARAQTAERMQATGATDSGVTQQYADADQAGAVARSAGSQQTALTANAGHESAARQANIESGSSAGFQGTEMRANLAQQLADQLSKIQVQQSTEDASRRQQALSFALQMQQRDDSANSSSQQMMLQLAQQGFQNDLAIRKAKEGEQNDAANAALKQAGQQLTKSQQDAQNLIALKKLSLSTSGQSKSRQASAAQAAYKKGELSWDQYRKFVEELG